MPRLVTKKQITLRVPIDTLAAAQAEADERGVPTSEILRSLWELRCRVKALPHGQRLAIVTPANFSDPKAWKDLAEVVEYIDVLAGAPAPKPKRRRKSVAAEQRPVPAL